ncbi:MAG: hypothetical protein ACRDRP_17865 [Pseudonocardiaceae bacterium]
MYGQPCQKITIRVKITSWSARLIRYSAMPCPSGDEDLPPVRIVLQAIAPFEPWVLADGHREGGDHCGDHDRAIRLIGKAETLAAQITDPDRHAGD